MVTEEELQNMSPQEIAEFQRKQCIFCKIIKEEIPSKKAYEDDKLISILDINPAAKGHLLVMPKEHYPILPVIPPDIAAHMFSTTKHLVRALKNAMVTNITTVFIANGAVAGQQSPHFLYHIIPREADDDLDNFIIPSNDFKEEEVRKYLEALKGKIGLMIRDYRAKRGKQEPKAPKPVSQEELAKFIDSNPQVREAITNYPEEFKKQVEADAELKRMFAGININKLSEALKRINI